MRAVKAEINARRRRGGAPEVPAWVWDRPGVVSALRRAVEAGTRSGFGGDWDEAELDVETCVEALAGAILKATRDVPPIAPPGLRPPEIPRHRPPSQKNGGGMSHPDVARYDAGGKALAEYFSWWLRRDGYADWCRRAICGGEYVTREEAWEFLTAPLPKVLSSEDYERLGLCPVTTQGRLLSKYLQQTVNAPFFYTNMLMIDPATGRPTATTETLYGGTESYCAEVYLPTTDGERKRRKRLVLHRNHEGYSYVAREYLLTKPYQVPGVHEDAFLAPLPAPFFPDGGRFVEGYGESVMGELIGIAHMLCELYPVSMWDMLEALLTGELPPQPAIEAFCWETRIERIEGPDELPSEAPDPDPLTAMGPVTLTVQPWVTPEALADAWRECRPSKGYSPSAIQADALNFVLAGTPPGQTPQWERLAGQWRQERGGGMTRGQLQRLFERGQNAILPPVVETEGASDSD